MFEVTTDSYRIPWLIWIQLIVLILLLVLIFFFIDLGNDDDDATVTFATTATASSSTKGFLFDEIQHIDKPITNHDSTASVLTISQHQQAGQSRTIKGEIGTESSLRGEENTEGEASPMSFHPCHYFEWATVAFLKCFGLDSTSDSSSNRKRRKNGSKKKT